MQFAPAVLVVIEAGVGVCFLATTAQPKECIRPFAGLTLKDGFQE